MERIIDCPVCFDDHQCFEDIQENFKSYMCFHCGFMSDSRYTLDRKEFEEYILKAPQLVQDLQYKDEELITFYPIVVDNFEPAGGTQMENLNLVTEILSFVTLLLKIIKVG